jgi:hypothetical protein
MTKYNHVEMIEIRKMEHISSIVTVNFVLVFLETRPYSEAILLLILQFIWREEFAFGAIFRKKGLQFHFYWMS